MFQLYMFQTIFYIRPIKPIAMKRILFLLTLLAAALPVKAQQIISADEPYGKISNADLEMTACDFEKDANAEILFDVGDLYFDQSWNVVLHCRKRIKIFNENGKDNANIRLEYYSNRQTQYITGLKGETINLVNGKPGNNQT